MPSGLDNVIIDKMGWASITRRNMEILNISYGDLFYLGIDLDESDGPLQSLFFIKIKEQECFNEFSEAVRFTRRKLRGGFQINSVLRLLKIRPPFICDIKPGGRDFDFSFHLPAYKAFMLRKDLHAMLRPLQPLVGAEGEFSNKNSIYEYE